MWIFEQGIYYLISIFIFNSKLTRMGPVLCEPVSNSCEEIEERNTYQEIYNFVLIKYLECKGKAKSWKLPWKIAKLLFLTLFEYSMPFVNE